MRYAMIALAALMGMMACSAVISKPVRREINPQGMAGKATAPISLSYEAEEEIQWGGVAEVRVFVRPQRAAASLRLRLTPDARLDMIYGPQDTDFGAVRAGEEVSVMVRLMASDYGLYYLNMLATGVFEGREVSRSGAVPLKFTSPAAPFHDASELKGMDGVTVKDGLVIMQASEGGSPHP